VSRPPSEFRRSALQAVAERAGQLPPIDTGVSRHPPCVPPQAAHRRRACARRRCSSQRLTCAHHPLTTPPLSYMDTGLALRAPAKWAGRPSPGSRRAAGGWAPPRACDSGVRTTRRGRATHREREAPSDVDIERGLREKAVTDPRAAEILLRWLQRPRPVVETPGVDFDSMSEAQLQRLHVGLVKVAALPDEHLHALLTSVLAGTEEA
jgi:hypothetical protein